MVKIGGVSKYLAEPPTQAQLESLTVDELIALARHKVSRTKPLKKALIAYIASRGRNIF